MWRTRRDMSENELKTEKENLKAVGIFILGLFVIPVVIAVRMHT